MKTFRQLTSRLLRQTRQRRRSTSPTAFTHDQPVWQPTMLAIAAIGVWLAMVTGCETTPVDTAPKKLRGQSIGTLYTQPNIRVRIDRNARELQITSQTQLIVKATTARGIGYRSEYVNAPVTVRRQRNTYIMTTADHVELRWQARELNIRSADGSPLHIDNKSYIGRLILYAQAASSQPAATESFDLVNHLPIEQYLPGVIARELYSDWHLETFKAQAVAARSYALDRRMLNRRRHYDLESTQQDQAYIGQTTNTTAVQAVEQTRGQVLVYEYYVLPAYYSSTCGGIGQDANIGVGEYRNLLPLRGRNRGGWCRNAPLYRWGPISRDRATLTRRFAAWGAARQHAIANLTTISHITAAEHNTAGRPTRFTITADDGHAYSLTAEALRIAGNFSNDTLPSLERGMQLKSSFVTATVVGDTVIFSDGRGFGHGVGLCQYGAQAMAKSGRDYAAILKFYYPGSEVLTAYE